MRLKKVLTIEFETNDLGNLKYFIGIKVARSKKRITVSQQKYVLDLLKETEIIRCKPADTPMEQNMDTRGKPSGEQGSIPDIS